MMEDVKQYTKNLLNDDRINLVKDTALEKAANEHFALIEGMLRGWTHVKPLQKIKSTAPLAVTGSKTNRADIQDEQLALCKALKLETIIRGTEAAIKEDDAITDDAEYLRLRPVLESGSLPRDSRIAIIHHRLGENDDYNGDNDEARNTRNAHRYVQTRLENAAKAAMKQLAKTINAESIYRHVRQTQCKGTVDSTWRQYAGEVGLVFGSQKMAVYDRLSKKSDSQLSNYVQGAEARESLLKKALKKQGAKTELEHVDPGNRIPANKEAYEQEIDALRKKAAQYAIGAAFFEHIKQSWESKYAGDEIEEVPKLGGEHYTQQLAALYPHRFDGVENPTWEDVLDEASDLEALRRIEHNQIVNGGE
ncbi:hypothetical protein KY329_03050 [Candidatus Woesearchaeota archaeon]|nr:hypothetical protein [Candidatus Woesearchaeota archaeon]